MSLIINPAILEQTFLPRLLTYREKQHKYLAEFIKSLFKNRNGNNLLVVGSPEIGNLTKTTGFSNKTIR